MTVFKSILISILFISFSSFSQEINQLDSNGKRHGIYKKYYDNTKVLRYEGEFFHGKEAGLFKFYKKVNGKAVLSATKQFNKDNNIAEVKFLASTGKVISEGQMEGKNYIGTWKYYQKNNDALLTLEHYNDNGKLDGERIVYYPNGAVAEKKLYVNGKRHGLSTWFTDANVLLKAVNYKDDLFHGEAKYYNNSGELTSEGFYKNDRKDGIWKFYENGKLVEEKDLTIKTQIIKKTP
ncbi:inner membrane protein translocase component YidC [Tamlana nanhaiensis]|uniref:Inner membrane protein translocase component YidC n=1 Tax=Neotamlana nanhaiensis TaxID=1382798 RepID=A0A0D7W341_9FLAO|nr:protein translocase component YidC [Tamlana nanhaiensis]KJD33133.1 inner membrane protein translocase component YidC [Tamlana nanhaiensis]